MRTDEFITYLRKEKQVLISMPDEDLKVQAEAEVLTPEIIAEIRRRKNEIIDFFRSVRARTKGSNIPITDPNAESYRLSPAQERLFFLQELDPASSAYNLPIFLQLPGRLDPSRLRHALLTVVNRQESLRTSFHWQDGRPVQRIRQDVELNLQISEVGNRDIQAAAREFIQPFHLDKAPLFRVELIEKSAEESYLFVDFHHIITDGASQELFLQELNAAYGGLESAALTRQYRDFAEWLRGDLRKGKEIEERAYWANHFEGIQSRIELPTDLPRADFTDRDSAEFQLLLNKELLLGLKELADAKQVSLFMLLLSALNVLMAHLAGEGQVFIGAPVTRRPNAAMESVIGLFVNTLVLRNHPAFNRPFSDFLQEVRQNTIDAFDHQDYPYEKLVQDLGVQGELYHNPLFDIFLNFQENKQAVEKKLHGLPIKHLNWGERKAKFDLNIYLLEEEANLQINCIYRNNLFLPETIAHIFSQYELLLRQIILCPDRKIGDFELTSLVPAPAHYYFRRTDHLEGLPGAQLILERLYNYDKKAISEYRPQDAVVSVTEHPAPAIEKDIPPCAAIVTAFLIFLHRVSGEENIELTVKPGSWSAADTQRTAENRDAIIVMRQEIRGDTTCSSLLTSVVQQMASTAHLGSATCYLTGRLYQTPGQANTEHQHSNELELYFDTSTTAPVLRLIYHDALFTQTSISSFLSTIGFIVEKMSFECAQEIGTLELIAPAEKERRLSSFNAVLEAEAKVTESLQQRLERSFSVHAAATAIYQDGRSITYEELWAASGRIAHYLLAQKILPGSTIGIYMSNPQHVIPAILGVIRARCVFVVLDITLPINRIEKMMEACSIQYSITDPENKAIAKRSTNMLSDHILLQFENCLNYASDKDFLLPNYSLDDPIYIYHTSGTTGTPKSILGKNRSLLHFINWEIENFSIGSAFRFGLLTNPAFDSFLRDVFVPLCSGGSIYIPDQETLLDGAQIVRWLNSHQIILIHCVPSFFKFFVPFVDSDNALPHLQYVLLAGEKIVPADLKKWYARIGNQIQLVNLYGATETTLVKSFYLLQTDDVRRKAIPVKPMPGARFIVLDSAGNPCPYGVPGEIYVRTPYRTAGYINAPELNQRHFLNNPFSENENDLIYRTGDTGRQVDDIHFEILGRNDQQVKIKGVRIELEEIKAALLLEKAVTDALVLVYEDKEKTLRIAAYFTADRLLSPGELENRLKEELPYYMLPSSILQLDRFPLLPNGKLNKKALPAPEQVSEIPTASTDALEAKLVDIWSNVLQLKAEQIAVDRSFFALGGHSFKARLLVNEIAKVLQVEVPIKAIFVKQDIRSLAAYIRELKPIVFESIPQAEPAGYYPVSSAQARLYFLYEFDRYSTAYNMPYIVRLHGDLNKQKLEYAYRQLIDRHEILRTSFEVVQGMAVQRIHEQYEVAIGYQEVSSAGGAAELATDFVQPFLLDRLPLMRIGLIKIADDSIVLMMDMHHIISDGVSQGILMHDLMALYNEQILPPLKLQYKDYAKWQSGRRQQEYLDQQRSFWLGQFSEEARLLNLPADFIRPAVKSNAGASLDFQISQELTRRLQEVSAASDCTLFMTMLALFNVFLAKLSGQDDIVVGSPVAGRQHAELEGMVGMFVNMLPLRNFPNGRQSFRSFLSDLKARTIACFENQYFLYEELIEALKLERDLCRNPLFDVVFSHQNFQQLYLDLDGIAVEDFRREKDISQFDFKLVTVEQGELLNCEFEYSTSLFKKATVEKFIAYFLHILQQIADNPDIPLAEIELITPHEKHKILEEYNKPPVPYACEKLISDLFEEQVLQTPEAIAVWSKEKTYSYTWLNETANQLARILRARGLVRESAVAVIMDRDVNLIVVLLAILKAGGKYVPIEPHIPTNRKATICQSVKAAFLFTGPDHIEEIRQLQPDLEHLQATFCMSMQEASVISLLEIAGDQLKPIELSAVDSSNLDKISYSEDLAYIIFTSGSSGTPKGVAVQHRPVINLIEWVNRTYGVSSYDKLLFVTSVSFDLSVYDIFGILAAGGSLRVADAQELADPDILARIMLEEQITFWDSAPAMLQQVIPFMLNRKKQAVDPEQGLRVCFLSGDWVPLSMPGQMKTIFPGLRFIALGGATEATVWSNHFEVEDLQPEWVSIPYGKPIQNARYLILDKDRNICPIGVAGDLYIGGQCLAREYFNDEALTRLKFISSPFHPGETLYYTGDMARWFEDGNIEFLGRSDSQVKVRGYRIELGEIQTRLLKHPAVRQAIVTVVERSKYDKYICAYYISDQPVLPVELRDFIGEELPDYMIPSFCIPLEAIPVSQNGKVDHKRLPAPEWTKKEGSKRGAETSLEKKLLEIWARVLHLDRDSISMNQDFFSLGGHSILAVQLISLIQEAMELKLKLKDIFSYPTIAGLASYLNSLQRSSSETINRIPDQDFYETSPAQKRLFFEQMLDEGSIAYNVSGAFEIQGKVDLFKIQQAYSKLVARHESLRTSFLLQDGEVRQRIMPGTKAFPLEAYTLEEDTPLETIFNRFVQPFDLSRAPLVRCALFTRQERTYLFMDIHHIVCDGLSLNILMNDFKGLYNGKTLPPPELRYIDYAHWVNAGGHKIREQYKFWERKLAGEIAPLDMPTVEDRNTADLTPAVSRLIILEAKTFSRIKELTSRYQVSDFMFFLSIFYLLLSKISGSKDIVIGTDAVGRMNPLLHGIVGSFINLLPLRLQLDPEDSYEKFLSEVGNTVLEAFEHQAVPYDQLMAATQLDNPAGHRLFHVHFAFINYLQSREEAEGILIKPLNLQKRATTQFEFKIEVAEHEQSFYVNFIFSKTLYEDNVIELLISYFRNLMYGVLNNNKQLIGQLPFEEYAPILASSGY